MKKKLILLLLTLTLCSFNLTKVNAETINWKAIKLYSSEKKVYRKYTTTDGKTVTSGNIAYIYMGNNTIYCIEMGKDIASDITTGKATTSNKGALSSYFSKNPEVKVGNQKIKVLDAIGLISKYGTDYYNARKEDGNETKMNKYYLAAQALIWQYLSEASVYGDSIKGDIKIIYYSNGKEQEIDLSAYKNNIINKINTYYKKPNIKGSIKAEQITLSEDGETYSFSLTDSNKVLNNYTITDDNDNVTCNKENKETITCTYSNTLTDFSEINLTFTKAGTGTNDKVFKVGNNYQATLLSNKLPAIEYTKKVSVGEPKHSLKIVKTDSNDKNKFLEGVSFQLCSDANCETIIDEPQVTDEEGTIIFNDLDANTKYYIKEVSTIEDYLLDSQIKEINIDTTKQNYDTNTLTYTENITNSKEVINGKIQIIKTDKETTVPLEGITFNVYDINDKVVETLKTDKDGKAITKSLTKGIYYVKEKATLDDYILNEEEQVITIDVNDKVYDLSFVNEKSPQTGDTNILLVITIAICTLICAIIMYIKKINLVKNNTI